MRSTHFRDATDRPFSVVPLTRELAERYADPIVALHNQIPFQHWTAAELLAEGDSRRRFLGKWEISRLALDQDSAPIGFCIGFELVPDGPYYPEPGIYMHRMAVAPEFRHAWVGALLHAETLRCAFERGLRFVEPRGELAVYGQTNNRPENQWIMRFYRDAGFSVFGRKPYPDREDVIMRMTYPQFAAARHTALAHECRIDNRS